MSASGHDAHPALRSDEDRDFIFSLRELRKVTKDLALHYERKLCLLADTQENRRLIGKYLEVFQFPEAWPPGYAVNASRPLRYARNSTTRRPPCGALVTRLTC
jgi:hypothetical protein